MKQNNLPSILKSRAIETSLYPDPNGSCGSVIKSPDMEEAILISGTYGTHCTVKTMMRSRGSLNLKDFRYQTPPHGSKNYETK